LQKIFALLEEVLRKKAEISFGKTKQREKKLRRNYAKKLEQELRENFDRKSN